MNTAEIKVKVQKFESLNKDGRFTLVEEYVNTPKQVTAYSYECMFSGNDVYFNIPNKCWVVEVNKYKFYQVFPNGYQELDDLMIRLESEV